MRLKGLLLLGMLCVLVASVSATNLNFQNPGDIGELVQYNNTLYTGYSTWVESTTGGNNYFGVASSVPDYTNYEGVWKILPSPYPTTYAAATFITADSGGFSPSVALLSATKSVLYVYGPDNGNLNAGKRYEVKISGGNSYIYINGVLADTHACSPNPSYVGFGGYSTTYYFPSGKWVYWDNLVYGATENKHVLGLPESDDNKFIILKDIVTPGASGLWNTTSNTPANSYFMSGTWSNGSAGIPPDALPNETIQLVHMNDGTVYATNYSKGFYNYTGIVTINIFDAIINNSAAPMGYYALTVPGSGQYSNMILYRSNGASVNWNSKSYSTGDTATVIYYVMSGGYWDSSYTYKVSVLDIFGNFKGNTSITTSTGSVTHAWGENDDPGVYYAWVVASKNGVDYILGSDWTELSSYITLNGSVHNAETTAVISGANVNITQGTLIVNSTTLANGSYTASGYLTGSPIYINVTKAGFRQYLYNFTPLVAETIQLDFTLVPISPIKYGIAIGGVFRDDVYGRSIASATATITNTTYSESYFTISNSVGYYKLDEGNMIDCPLYGTGCESVLLTNGRLYKIVGSKIGYSNSSTYSLTVVSA